MAQQSTVISRKNLGIRPLPLSYLNHPPVCVCVYSMYMYMCVCVCVHACVHVRACVRV